MTHDGIFATAAECASKVGAGVDTNGWTEANINQWCAEAESYINIFCRFNFSDEYAGLNQDVKKILTEACSNLVAIYGLSYNLLGVGSTAFTRYEAEDRINILYARFQNCVALLRNQNSVTYMKGA